MRPILFTLGEFKLYAYPLLMGLAWGVAYQFARATINKFNLPSSGFNSFAMGVFLSSWIGAKLLFLLVSVPGGKGEVVGSVHFWTGGGFVFFGGLLFASVFTF